MKSKSLTTLKINKEMYSIRATKHSLERMAQRNIDEYLVASDLLSLGKDKIQELQNEEEDVALIDEDNEVSIIFGFSKNTIKVITVIDKSDIYVKSNTKVERL
ncbi:MAG: DUF4258 domain-containing protein [Bacillota bacterium]